MRSLFPTLLLALLSLSLNLPTVLASTCSASTANAWPADGCPPGSQACQDLAAQGQCYAVGGSACDDAGDTCDSSDNSDTCAKKMRRRMLKRDSFQCDSSQTCYMYTNNVLLCLDVTSGDYVDQYGGHGNVNTGAYDGPVSSDGTVTGDTSGSGATATATGSNSRTTATAGSDSTSTMSGEATKTASSVSLSTATGEAMKVDTRFGIAAAMLLPALGAML